MRAQELEIYTEQTGAAKTEAVGLTTPIAMPEHTPLGSCSVNEQDSPRLTLSFDTVLTVPDIKRLLKIVSSPYC
ncbi:hypothetical protein [Candidatus Magnetaquicoccus inordinatus]|uniref:hypothetical protein n=1 Tax=Candidatus Magnetaquicoccus inordinatus TaxID=2496818 RepID=UPI00102C205A|nr:hypothetical protein [Candidatus Magnetaquicoccus inordinatus]